MSEIVYYAIELDTETSVTDASMGLQSGVFRWITGRPTYDGSTTTPTNENGSDNTNIWYNDFILVDGIGDCVRNIDLRKTGDYSTSGSFSFGIRKDKIAYSDLVNNDIYLQNKSVTYYVVIDDVFYHAFSGKIAEYANDETQLIIKCQDSSTDIHTPIPPNTITETDFPNASDDSLGETIPVCIGECYRARLYDIEEIANAPITLVVANMTEYKAAFAYDYSESDETKTTITLRTSNVTFTADELVGYYLRCVQGKGDAGDDADTTLMLKIIGNDATSANDTLIQLGEPVPNLLDNVVTAIMGWPGTPSNFPTQYTWYFQVIQADLNHIVSNSDISEFKTDSVGRTQLWFYDDEDKKYIDSKNLVRATDETTDNDIGHPFVNIVSTSYNTDGNLFLYDNIVPANAVKNAAMGGNGVVVSDPDFTISPLTSNEAIDRNRGSSKTWRRQLATRLTLDITIDIPDEIINTNINDIYICVDAVYGGTISGIPGTGSYDYSFKAHPVDVYNIPLVDKNDTSSFYSLCTGLSDTVSGSPPADTDLNTLPNSYYDDGGDDNDESSKFNAYNENLLLDSDALKMIRNGYMSPKVLCKFEISTTGLALCDIKIKQIGFIVKRKANIKDGSAYTSCMGEPTKDDDTFDFLDSLNQYTYHDKGCWFNDLFISANWTDGLSSYGIDSSNDIALLDTIDPGDYVKAVCTDGIYIYAIRSVGNYVYSYSINETTGALTQVDSLHISVGNSVTMNCDNNGVIVITSEGTVRIFSVKSTNGNLALISTITPTDLTNLTLSSIVLTGTYAIIHGKDGSIPKLESYSYTASGTLTYSSTSLNTNSANVYQIAYDGSNVVLGAFGTSGNRGIRSYSPSNLTRLGDWNDTKEYRCIDYKNGYYLAWNEGDQTIEVLTQNSITDYTVLFSASRTSYISNSSATISIGDNYIMTSNSSTAPGLSVFQYRYNFDTNTIYRAFQYLLESHDGLSRTLIDYDNVETMRNNWYCGRQLIDRKNSNEYIRELAKQSFVAVYPTRDGKIKMTAWLDSKTSQDTHDITQILRDSIKFSKKTGIKDLYNDFYIQYHFNPETNKYDRAVFVTKVDQSTYTAGYVGGISSGSSVDMEKVWQVCADAYTRTKNVKRLDDSLSKLSWFIDRTEYDSTLTTGTGTGSSAWLFLKNCSEWLTRQKDDVRYALPINSTHIVRELCDYITFNDTIYTEGNDRTGWIQRVTISAKNERILLDLILEPDDGITIQGDIIETGSQTDTITESGAQTDTITEGA